ncbi:MAG: hypothetical protein HY006_00640 [Candidatus Sungbacteria bacterium]|nr:hypothetical protein [Candidatus Sungbacteria bacterium]
MLLVPFTDLADSVLAVSLDKRRSGLQDNPVAFGKIADYFIVPFGV